MATPSQLEALAVRIGITLLILVAGTVLARFASRLTRRLHQRNISDAERVQKVPERQHSTDTIVSYLVMILTLVGAMVYLNEPVARSLLERVTLFLPNAITAVLVFFIGAILVRGIMTGLKSVVTNLEVKRQVKSVGVSPKAVRLFLGGIRVFLYLVVIEFSVVQLGISTQIIDTTLVAASYGLVALLVLLGFFGFRDLIQNYAAGIYLRGSDVLKPGRDVKIDDESGEIRDISLFGTTISTDSGYFMLAPNKALMDREILFKRVRADIETLEDIKSYFLAQDPDSVGPASAEMALAMFGFDITQSQLVEDGQNGPETLQAAIEDQTAEGARAAFVEYDQITELDEELKTWFNEGALVIPHFSKETLFPKTDEDSYYALAVGAEGDEVLLVDPSRTASGGVYYVETDELAGAMADAPDDRGYLIIAPKGTTAYWRIKEGLIYADRSAYAELSKTLETRLRKLLREGRILKEVMPSAAQDYITEWRQKDAIDRVWDAKQRKMRATDTTDDEGEDDDTPEDN